MKKIHLLLLVLLFSVPKFLFLDQDAPSYMISGISQEDEAYYCIGGVNRFLVDEDRIHPAYAKADDEALEVINTPLTYWSLKCFGNNYYGLRLPVVFISILINLLIVFFASRKGLTKWPLLLLILFLSTEFYSFLFGRFYNPQIFCMLFITVILLLVFSESIKPSMAAYFAGFLCVFMILGVYIYTLYFALAIYAWYFLTAIKSKTCKPFLFAVSGGLSALVLWIMYILVADIDYKALLEELVGHGGGAKAGVPIGLVGILKSSVVAFMEIVATNFFRFNLFLLPLFVILLFYCIKTLRSDKFSLLFGIILVMLVFQNFFVHSYPFKKHITLYPVILLFAILNFNSLVKWISSEISKPLLVFCAILSLAFMYYCYKLNNSQIYWAGFNYGYYENISSWLSLAGLVLSLILSVVLFGQRFSEKLLPLFRVLLPVCFFPCAYLITEQFFLKKTFFSRDSLIAMKPEISGQYVLQDFSHAFQFYNDSKPALSDYNKVEMSKLNMDSFYKATNGYAILKLFRNDDNEVRLATVKNSEVTYNGMKFLFLEKYPLRYYDYYLLKYINH